MTPATARTEPRGAAAAGAGEAHPRSWPARSWSLLREVVREVREDDLPTTAQALAYSFFLAIPAMFLVLLGAFSIIASPDDVTRLMTRAEKIMPPEAAKLL